MTTTLHHHPRLVGFLIGLCLLGIVTIFGLIVFDLLKA